jgi:hypothetical protein
MDYNDHWGKEAEGYNASGESCHETVGEPCYWSVPTEQSQEYQLAMPFVCAAALLFRRWLSASGRSCATWATQGHASRLRKRPRPELWLPYVFTSSEETAEAGMCEGT